MSRARAASSPEGAPLWTAIEAPPEDELLVVVGPTASGKTELAIRLAERLGGEIIGADSVQIYRGFDIGSGKPTAEERARAPHHLVDIADALSPIEAQTWADLADVAIQDIRARSKLPIVCGGTFLWVKALVWGLAPMPPADAAIRAEHQRIADAEGRAALHARLAAIDPASAERLAPNDLVRVSRALEVHALSGRTMTEWQSEHGFRSPRRQARFVAAHRTPEDLDDRVARRTSLWLETGWIEEVRTLIAQGYGESRPMKSVGYREVQSYLEAKTPETDLHTAIVRATRTFIRRQRTWLRDLPINYVHLT